MVAAGNGEVLMKKLFIFLLVLSFASASASALSEEELPMYGGQPRTAQQQVADTTFVEGITKAAGSREVAIERTLQKGWELLTAGDLGQAIKRFNQAWLLDSKNPDVFHAFGVYMSARGQLDEAIQMYKEALELNQKHALAMCDLARATKDKALWLAKTYGPSKEVEVRGYLTQALTLCADASRAATLDKDKSYVYYQWATMLAMNGDLAGAWEKIHLSRKYGGEFIEPGFIQQLSRDMPDPRN